MGDFAATGAIGLAAGVLSGMFGIGGGIITTPAIRLLLGAPALVAVGTPLVAVVPSAVTGALSYARHGVSDVRTGLTIGAVGSLTAVFGAWLSEVVGGSVVLLLTAALLGWISIDMLRAALRSPSRPQRTAEDVYAAKTGAVVLPGESRGPAWKRPGSALVGWKGRASIAIGVIAGLYSGFLGVGGGFVVVPLLDRWLGFDLKRSVATSLVAVAVLSLPGTITHALLGHIDWAIGLALVVGVVPGAALGARIALGARERTLRFGFAALLALVGVWLAVSELSGLAA